MLVEKNTDPISLLEIGYFTLLQHKNSNRFTLYSDMMNNNIQFSSPEVSRDIVVRIMEPSVPVLWPRLLLYLDKLSPCFSDFTEDGVTKSFSGGEIKFRCHRARYPHREVRIVIGNDFAYTSREIAYEIMSVLSDMSPLAVLSPKKVGRFQKKETKHTEVVYSHLRDDRNISVRLSHGNYTDSVIVSMTADENSEDLVIFKQCMLGVSSGYVKDITGKEVSLFIDPEESFDKSFIFSGGGDVEQIHIDADSLKRKDCYRSSFSFSLKPKNRKPFVPIKCAVHAIDALSFVF